MKVVAILSNNTERTMDWWVTRLAPGEIVKIDKTARRIYCHFDWVYLIVSELKDVVGYEFQYILKDPTYETLEDAARRRIR